MYLVPFIEKCLPILRTDQSTLGIVASHSVMEGFVAGNEDICTASEWYFGNPGSVNEAQRNQKQREIFHPV